MNCQLCSKRMWEWQAFNYYAYSCPICEIEVSVDDKIAENNMTINYQDIIYSPAQFERLKQLKAFW